MCCSNAAWKREVVPDHKFDFIDVHEFHATNCTTRLQYAWFYLLFIISVAVYVADVYTAIALLASNRWSGSILQSEAARSSSKGSSVLEVPFNIGKWIFTGCIIFSFLLLLWEARKSRAIIKSRDISYAFTNVMSQNWYALRSYDHFCFFCQIDNSKKKKDEFAFFIFFTFKGWKRLLLADAPRQVINGITLYSFGKSENWTTDLSVYFGGGFLKTGIIITMLFTVVIFVISAVLLLIAAVMYVPLLCYIQGNLKEYCCHKVDKRIAELMKRKNRKRLAKEAEIARKEARGDFSHLKDKKTGKLTAAPLPQPTLPKVGLRDNELYTPSYSTSDAGSIRGGYQYPPPSSSVGHGAGGAGYFDHHRYERGPTPLARTAYPYVASEPDSLDKHGAGGGGLLYSQSVSSLDAFAHRGEPMPYDSSSNLVGQLQGGHDMTRAPSYRSRDGNDDVKSSGAFPNYHGQQPSYSSEAAAHAHGGGTHPLDHHSEQIRDGPARSVAIGRGPSVRSNGYSEEYVAPSRQMLYERSAGASAQPSHDSTMLSYAIGDPNEPDAWETSTGRYPLPPQELTQNRDQRQQWTRQASGRDPNQAPPPW